jgi:hypothetical protein
MVGWMSSIASLLKPVYEEFKKDILLSKVLSADDSPVKVQDRNKKANIRRGYEWIMRGDEAHPANVFYYAPGRGRAAPLTILKEFRGFLQADCFSGNLAICAETGATLVACHAHARRYFNKARANSKELCDQILDMFDALFEVERTARELNLSGEDLVKMRRQESAPLLKQMKEWLDTQILSALPASSFGKAVSYCLNNWDALNVFLSDACLRLDNNLAEQQMKMFATGRKNWYFFGSDESGEVNSILLSVISTCLRNAIEPGAYLRDVLSRIASGANCSPEELVPYRWKPIAEMEGVQSTPEMALA